MAKNDSQTSKAKEANLIPPEIAAMGKKRLDELITIQTEQLEKLKELNQNWFERMQLEAELASEFTAKLSAARSMPEVAAAYQEWAQRHMEMAAEDAKRVVADGQKLIETGTRLMTNGWRPNGQGGST